MTRRSLAASRLGAAGRPARVGLVALALAIAACAPEESGPDGDAWRAQVDTIGDTVIVRTLSGSEWGAASLVEELRIGALEGADHEMFGEVVGLAVDRAGTIFIYDRHVPALRRYAPDGRYLGTLGREGGGPGEYANSDGGLAVLADGRIVLRDPGNARFTVYGPDGEYVESWPARGGMFTSTPIFPAADGGFYNPIFGGGQGMRLVRHAADGTPGDTLPLPEREVEAPQLRAQSPDGNMSQSWNLPFAPTAMWTFHPDGHHLSAVSDRYAVDLPRHDGSVLRIAKDAEAVPVGREERAADEERVTRAMRRVDPSWRWTGPPIPQTKPIIRSLYTGEDGRIWVQLHQPGERVPDEETEPGPDGRPPVPQFREPVVFDVFEKDGRYLGRVEAPADFTTWPRPVFRGDHVWATARDDLGVQSLVRYRIVPERGPQVQGGDGGSMGEAGHALRRFGSRIHHTPRERDRTSLPATRPDLGLALSTGEPMPLPAVRPEAYGPYPNP